MSKATTSSTPSQHQHQHAAHGHPVPHDKIAKRAYEKWCKRGQPHGTEQQDWYEAEAELLAEMGRPGTQPQQRRM